MIYIMHFRDETWTCLVVYRCCALSFLTSSRWTTDGSVARASYLGQASRCPAWRMPMSASAALPLIRHVFVSHLHLPHPAAYILWHPLDLQLQLHSVRRIHDTLTSNVHTPQAACCGIHLHLQGHLVGAQKVEGESRVQVPAATQARHQELALEQLVDLLRERDGAAETLQQAQEVNKTQVAAWCTDH